MKTRAILTIAVVIGFFSLSAHAQDSMPKYGQDSATCVINNSLYYEFFNQWKQSGYKNPAWKDAVKPWRWVFLNCPKSTINIFLHGEKIVEELIKTAPDKETKEAYIDTLQMVYANRIKYYGKGGYVKGKWGSDLYKLRPSAYEESYKILKQSIELEGNESNGSVLIYYFRSAEKLVKAEKAEKDLLVEIYDQTSEIIDYNIKLYQEKNKPKKVSTWENIRGNIELSFEPYASCEDLIGLYTVKFNEKPDDLDLLRKITKILDKKDCTDSDLFLQALEKLIEIEPEPSAKSAELAGKLYIKRENFTEAARYLNKAIELEIDNNERADAHYLLAIVYQQLNQLSKSRAECYDILKIRPNDGKAYILIGDLYASSAKSCGENDLTSKVAYWAAVDKYIKAKNVDPEVAELASTKINTFTQYFPATETIFFYDLKKGDNYTVECWINENTKVRTSD